MRPFDELFRLSQRVENLLPDHRNYLAHLPDEDLEEKPEEETLSEHAGKVIDYAQELCAVHSLDPVVERLIVAAVQHLDNQEKVADLLKEAFVGTVAFHDFGKINPYFQRDRMKNQLFLGKHPELMKPRHGHSALGAYLFLSYFLQKITTETGFSNSEKVWLAAAMTVFADSIIEHHNGRFGKPEERLKTAVFGQNCWNWRVFLEKYGFPEAQVLKAIAEKPEIFGGSLARQENFPLFALARLNFSLLTSADNLATSDYMKQDEVNEFGVIDDDLRGRMLTSVRMSEGYNEKALALADLPGWQAPDCTERSPRNLNALREQMSVEVLCEVRQIVVAKPEQRLFYLEAPTGGGKTNLSMLAAAELLRLCPEVNKVLYVFPFTTLITQTHRAVKKVFGLAENEVGLLHSKAGFREREVRNEEEDGVYGDDWKNDLHLQFAHFPVCLMTHIRFFDLLKSQQKSAIYPLHRLANSVVILDELQSYPPLEWDKMLYFIGEYSRFFNIRFILMSATLPRIDRLEMPLQNRPEIVDLLPNAQRFFQNKNFRERVRFRFDLLENPEKPGERRPDDLVLAELADVLLNKSKEYADLHAGRVFTMVEFIFKKSATEFKLIMDECAKAEPFFDFIFVLSGTILEPRRREIINFLKRNADARLKILLITTQVVEAGVDIDMDLGFKNVSLIDSDEQLAGRINRNVKKEPCEVYLFKANEPRTLYGADLRHKITRDEISLTDHQEILEKKNFKLLYNKVLALLDNLNNKAQVDNFNTKYLPLVSSLDFREIDQKFKLIDQDNLSVFVPMALPLEIEGQNPDEHEQIFDKKTELEFLRKNKVWEEGEPEVSGAAVWRLYRRLLGAEKEKGFFQKRISKRILQGILSKFTFSMFKSRGLEQKLAPFTSAEKSLDGYIYLCDDFSERGIYDYQTGLVESQLESVDSRIW